MNFRLTVVLVLVMLIVGGAGIWSMWHPKGDTPASATLANPVFKPQPKAIQTISLSRRKAVEVAFARADNHWDVTAPIHGLANEQPGVFADQIRNLEYKDKFTPDSSGLRSLENMGLTDPHATLTFTDDEKKTTTLLLGKRTPAKTLFMRIEGDSSNTVYEVDVRWLDDLEKDPTDFRSKEFAGVTPADVTALTVGHANQAITLTKDGAAGTWSITKPVPTRANTTVITDVLEALREAQIESFSTLTADNPITGLASPVLTVAVTSRVGPAAPPTAAASQPAASQASAWKLTTLSFGNFSDLTKKSIYARIGDSPEAVIVSADKFSKINKELNDLRDPAITPAPVDAASTIEILTPGEGKMGVPPKMTLTRKAGTWQIASNQSASDLPGDTPAMKPFR